MILPSTENILQVWLYFTCKQIPKNGKTFSEKYYKLKQTKHKKPSNTSHDLRHYFVHCVAEANKSIITMGFKVWTFRDKRDSVVKVVEDTPFKNTSLTLEETEHLTSNQKF